jgi:acyl-CoA thioesterase I
MFNRNNIFLIGFILFFISCKTEAPSPKTAEEIKTEEVAIAAAGKPISGKKTILFFGNSLTAGLGLEEEQSFPSLIQKMIDSVGGNYTVINAGLSGDTSADGFARSEWVLNQPIDIFVLELGANDALRGLDPNETNKNLRKILDNVKSKYPAAKIVIAGMKAPTNMGKGYLNIFDNIFPKLAKDYDAGLIPFLLEDVATITSLNLPDGKHPNVEGQKIVAKNVWTILKTVI